MIVQLYLKSSAFCIGIYVTEDCEDGLLSYISINITYLCISSPTTELQFGFVWHKLALGQVMVSAYNSYHQLFMFILCHHHKLPIADSITQISI